MASLNKNLDAFSNRHNETEIKLMDKLDKPNEHLIARVTMQKAQKVNNQTRITDRRRKVA